MCLYNSLIKNPRYTVNKKNGGIIPPIIDNRVLYVPIQCGNCIECRKKKSRDWTTRLLEDIKDHKNGKFITLTFSNESIQKLITQCELQQLTGYSLDNQIATKAIHYFRERWRKKFGKSIRHWLVTELGHNGTENIHMHGILYTTETYKTIYDVWQYGFIWPRPETNLQTYVNAKTVNYITKYITKADFDHKNYIPIVLASPGIGKGYTEKFNATKNKYKANETNEAYTTESGYKIALPIYYRNKIYTDEEKEKLWIEKLNKNTRYILGVKYQADNEAAYRGLIDAARRESERLGYGSNRKVWEEIEYENKKRELMQLARMCNKHGYPASWDEK